MRLTKLNVRALVVPLAFTSLMASAGCFAERHDNRSDRHDEDRNADRRDDRRGEGRDEGRGEGREERSRGNDRHDPDRQER